MSSPTRENPGSDLTVERLGEFAGMSPRNFTRVFAREIGMTPGKFVALSRLESARRYLEHVDDAHRRLPTRAGTASRTECGWPSTETRA